MGDTQYKFGIRRGSKSDHAHLVKDLRLSQTKLRQLAECSMSEDQYIEDQRRKTQERMKVGG